MLAVVRWRRWRHRRAGRTVSVVAATVLVVLAVASVANSSGSFYPTLGSLIGSSQPAATAAVAAQDDVVSAGSVRTVPGPGGVTVTVYLPAAATAAGADGVRFPVVEWLGPLAAGDPLVTAVDAAIAEHRIAPVVVLAAGRADPTVLRAWAGRSESGLAVRGDRAGWALAAPLGSKACPLAMALARPGDFAAAAGPACEVTAPPTADAPPALLAVATSGDRAAVERAASVVPPAQLTGYVLPDAADAPGAVVGWLGGRLAGPVRAPATDRAGADDVPS